MTEQKTTKTRRMGSAGGQSICGALQSGVVFDLDGKGFAKQVGMLVASANNYLNITEVGNEQHSANDTNWRAAA